MSTITHTTSLPLPYDQERAPDWFLQKAQKARRFILNLAPLRYAFVTEEGGPITQVDYGHDEYLGQTWHISRALLQEAYQHPMGKKLRLFHPSDGAGMGKTRLEARAKAISEALERWAYFETSSGPDYMTYGYQYANSTKGMAAFPGIFSRQARRLAMEESYEYFTMDAWWNGALSHWTVEREDATIVFIDQPHFNGYVALAIRHLDLNNYVAAYGIGSGTTPADAEVKAQLEASRLQTILAGRDSVPAQQRVKPILEEEARMLYLASQDGYSHVKDRLAARPWRSAPKPKVIFDGPVTGPWNKYTYVWRYALEPLALEGHFGQFAA